MKYIFVISLLLYVFVFVGCRVADNKTMISNDFEISNLELRDEATINDLITRITKTKCFSDYHKGRKILWLLFRKPYSYVERDSVFLLSIGENCYEYDASELKTVYGGIWLKHKNDSLLLVVESDSIAGSYFKKTDKTIDVEKYGERTLDAYEIIWFFKYIEDDLVLFSESCYRIE